MYRFYHSQLINENGKYICFFCFNFFNVYFLREREKDRTQVGKRQNERKTQNEGGSSLQAVSTEPDMGFKLMEHEIMT